MEFSPLTVVAGLNASGKSNLFDALRLLSLLAETTIKNAFNDQRGELAELFTKYGELSGRPILADAITFEVEMLVNKSVKDNWGGEARLKYTRLRYELTITRETDDRGIDHLFVRKEELVKLNHKEDEWVRNNIPQEFVAHWRPQVTAGGRGKPYIRTLDKNGTTTITLPQDGRAGGKETPANVVQQTVLSGINSVDFPHVFAAREEMRSWKFLQLDPRDLREPTRYEGAGQTITQSGANLASTLFRLKETDAGNIHSISNRMNSILPQINSVDVVDDSANKQYVIHIRNEDARDFTSRVLSEGTLRLLALCVLQYDDEYNGLICFEEPENGIHPFRIRSMADLLVDLSTDFSNQMSPLRQVIVNTHSPVLVGRVFEREQLQTVRVYFSELVTQVYGDGSERRKLSVTKMISVIPPHHEAQRVLDLDYITQTEKLISVKRLYDYLESSDFEDLRRNINPDA